MNDESFRNVQPIRRRYVAHRLRYLHFHKLKLCARRSVHRRSTSLNVQYRSGWSQLRLEKFPDALGESWPAAVLRSLISADCSPLCSSLRQSKKAPRIIIGVSAIPLSSREKLGVEISI